MVEGGNNSAICEFRGHKALLLGRLTGCKVEGVHHVVTREKGFMGARGPESRRGAEGERVGLQQSGNASTAPSFGSFQLCYRLRSLQRVIFE